jgi:hypothetical protein
MTYETMKHYIGKRIEIPVHYDLWMQGARFGKVTAIRRGKSGQSAYLLVKIDHSQVSRSLKLWAHDVEYAKIIG